MSGSDPDRIKRVLVTGASGFIGRWCLPRLRETEYDVHALTCTGTRTGEDVTWHVANLFDSDAVAQLIEKVRPTHLLHLAWYAEPGKYWTAPENFDWLRASVALLQAFSAYGGRRVVMAGTCAEYDWRYGWCSEAITPLNPATPYGACKNALQAVLSTFSEQFGLSSAWARIFFPYGPHEHPSRLVASVTRALIEGRPAFCSSGEQVRDFIHVQDVASACVELLQSDVQGAVNIGSGHGVPIKDIALRIGERLERPDLVKLGALSLAPDEPPLLIADVRRLAQEVSWRPTISLEEGLETTINWWRNRLRG